MRILISITLILTVTSCTGQTTFEQFAGQIKPLPKQFTLKTRTFSNERTQSIEQRLLDRFRTSLGGSVFGKITFSSGLTGIIYMLVGDVNKPILVTYDPSGNKLDSLNIFEASGYSLNSRTLQIAELKRNNLHVTDSIVTWKMDKDLNVLDEIESIKVNNYKYVVDNNGRIRKK